uniref:Uncharacterized protein n=1 Tax=Panagrolaimus sp. ES5 TaxID=591445 RepID=A0AC34GLJ8_9BILA
REFCVTLTSEIEKANASLISINHPRDVVSQDSIDLLRSILTGHVNVLLEGIFSRERALAHLREELADLEEDHKQLKDELAFSDSVVARLENEKRGLGGDVKKRLNALGYNTVQELINGHMVLQDRLELSERNVSSRSVSRAPSQISLNERYRQPQSNAIPLKSNKSLPLFVDKAGDNGVKSIVQLPMPEKFNGK